MAPAVAAGLCSRRCPPFESCKNYRKRSSSRRERGRAHASELNNKPNAGMPPSLRATSPGCHKSRYAGEDSAASRRLQSPSARAARRTSHTLSLPTTTVRRDEDVPQDVAGEENVPRARSGLERSGPQRLKALVKRPMTKYVVHARWILNTRKALPLKVQPVPVDKREHARRHQTRDGV